MRRLFVAALALSASLEAQLGQGNWKTDLSKKSIDLAELKSGGPPKGGIPAIDHPKFDNVAQVGAWLSPKEPVLVVEHEGEARAYPLQVLIWHELVNDRVGEFPILVSYCPLCNSAVVFDRRADGRTYDFGVSGMLRQSDMVMYDRQTDSLWQQITGEAIVGALTGKKLEIVDSQTVSFDAFRRMFPQGKVLNRDTGHQRPYGENPYAGYEFGNRLIMPVSASHPIRLPPLERIVVVNHEGKSKAYPFTHLRRSGVVEDRTKDERFVVFFEQGTVTALDRRRIAESRAVGAVGVFSPELEGKRLKFERKGGRIVDKETGSTWNVFGAAIDGALAGKRLKRVEHGVYFAFAWLVFSPETEIVGGPGAAADDREILPQPARNIPSSPAPEP